MPARIQVINQVITPGKVDDWRLCFQWCQYVYTSGMSQFGYRFIWRRPGGRLQPARGQARIPSISILKKLVEEARQAGWGDFDGNGV